MPYNHPSGSELVQRIKEFSKKNIAPVAEKIGTEDRFPWEIWQKLGTEGFSGMAIPASSGGLEAGDREISAALHELVYNGCNLGLSLSLMIHNLVARNIIFRHGSENQKKIWLPLMSKGIKTVSFAVSEPEKGGHPKFMTTRADLIKPCLYSIYGEKSYLTNGPIADAFITIAITSENEGRKKFSAFLVESDKDGIEKAEPMRISFFRPSPHGSIKLKGYEAGSDAIVGTAGQAYDEIAMPFRDAENCLMAGPVSGAMRRIVHEAGRLVANSAENISKETVLLLGRLLTVSNLASGMADQMAGALEKKCSKQMIQSLHLQFREVSLLFRNLISHWSDEPKNQEQAGLFYLLKNDLMRSAGLGDYIHKINLSKTGNSVIKESLNSIL